MPPRRHAHERSDRVPAESAKPISEVGGEPQRRSPEGTSAEEDAARSGRPSRQARTAAERGARTERTINNLPARAKPLLPRASRCPEPAALPPSERTINTIRILLADDQHLVRGALAALLSLEDDLEVVGQVGRGDEVVDAVTRLGPDVVVMDVEMPGIDGLAAAAAVRVARPATRVLIVTTFGRAGYLRRAMEAGALGFVVKDAPPDALADAVRRVARGERVVDPALAATTLASGPSPLTGRERDVLVAARDGATVADIAGRLFLSEGTVRNYLSAAIAKTGARNRMEALRTAEESGWL